MSGRSGSVAHGDEGLQPERTSLAWVRTLLSLAAVALLCLRFLPAASGAPWTGVAPAAALLVAVVLLPAVPAHRRRACEAFADESAPPALWRSGVLVAVVVVLGTGALVAVQM